MKFFNIEAERIDTFNFKFYSLESPLDFFESRLLTMKAWASKENIETQYTDIVVNKSNIDCELSARKYIVEKIISFITEKDDSGVRTTGVYYENFPSDLSASPIFIVKCDNNGNTYIATSL